MRQFLSDNIDQLDLAIEQLTVDDRNFDRFAFMLIDNMVELTLHKFAEGEELEYRQVRKSITRDLEYHQQLQELKKERGNIEYTKLEKQHQMYLENKDNELKAQSNHIRKAMSQNFVDKLNACCKLGLLEDELAGSIRLLHQFRNTAYHKGLRHEGILHSLSLFYLECACVLVDQFKPRFWMNSSDDKISQRTQKYIGESSLSSGREVFNNAFSKLLEIAQEMGHTLVLDLAADMKSTIEQSDDAIDFIVDNSFPKITREHAVAYSQIWPIAYTDDVKKSASLHASPEKDPVKYIEWVANNTKGLERRDPISSWKKKYEQLSVERSPHLGLQKYCNFMRETKVLREHLEENAWQVELQIQEDIDMARRR